MPHYHNWCDYWLFQVGNKLSGQNQRCHKRFEQERYDARYVCGMLGETSYLPVCGRHKGHKKRIREMRMKYPPLPIEIIDNELKDEDFRVLRTLTLEITDALTIVIHKGYISDGASVPRFFWRLLSPKMNKCTLTPSIVHDYLYETKLCTRKEADEWYYNALIENGYPKWKAMLTYAGVRLFGGSHW